MAGRFINTNSTKKSMIDNTISSIKTILNNPYYLFNDKKASICTYYNLNTTMTTLDEATRSNYGEINENSPLRFNKVKDFFLYGITRIEPTLDIGDYGLESSDINNEAVIIPHTVVPYPGDRFILDQLGEKYLFKVTSVNPNTLDTGTTMYKISYVLESSDGKKDIESQVVKTYKFIAENIGTNFNSIMQESDIDLITMIQKYTVMLKDYFIQLFYDVRVQTFVYCKHEFKVHDPYLLEFIIRNNILSGSTNYLSVQHQLYLPTTFGVDYDRTIFASIENNDIQSHIGKFIGNLLLVTQRLSLLYAYPNDYYYMEYRNINSKFHIIDIFDDPEFGEKIKNNDTSDDNVFKTIIIKYFNKSEITEDLLNKLKHIDYMSNKQLYYMIPITIFALESYVQNILSKTSN